jgi:hypothetical protein
MNVVGNRSVYRIKCRVDGSIEQFVGKSIDNKKNSMVLQTDNACQKKLSAGIYRQNYFVGDWQWHLQQFYSNSLEYTE